MVYLRNIRQSIFGRNYGSLLGFRAAYFVAVAVIILQPVALFAVPAPPANLVISGDTTRPTLSWSAVADGNFDASAWIKKGEVPFTRIGNAVTFFDDKLWSFGGLPDVVATEATNDIWSSTDGVNWTQVVEHAPWSSRAYHSAVVFDGKLWVMGGANAAVEALQNDIWSSTDGVNWTQVVEHAPWQARISAASLVFNDKIWIMGGSTGPGQDLGDVWYSGDGVNWSETASPPAWSARSLVGAIVYDGKMWIVGGISSNAPTSDVWSSENGVDWIAGAGSPDWTASGFVFFNSLVAKDNYLYDYAVIAEMDGSFSHGIWRTTNGTDWEKIPETAAFPTIPGMLANFYSFNDRLWLSSGVNPENFEVQDSVYATVDNTTSHYKMCWDMVQGGCKNKATTSETFYKITQPLSSGTWYLSVLAVNADNQESALGASIRHVVPTLSLLPASGDNQYYEVDESTSPQPATSPDKDSDTNHEEPNLAVDNNTTRSEEGANTLPLTIFILASLLAAGGVVYFLLRGRRIL